jgi:Mrp family chromosome partitioning ATPase
MESVAIEAASPAPTEIVIIEIPRPKIEPRLLAAARDIVDRIVAEDSILSTGPGRVIGVIGARGGQGASTVAGYLAKALADRLESMGEDAGDDRVVLVDTDIVHPAAHERFDVPLSPGLCEWLKAGGAEGQGSAHMTEHARLSVVSAGEGAGVLILPERFRRITHALAHQYRFVVIDLPALNESAAAARLAGVCRDVLFVIESGSLHEEAARQSLEQLRHCGAQVIGVALNKREFPVPEWLYRHS